MDVELKHALEVSRNAWFIRLYQFVWCDTTPVRRKTARITFCALFWGYLLMPIGLLLVPFIYGVSWGWAGLRLLGGGVAWAFVAFTHPFRSRRRIRLEEASQRRIREQQEKQRRAVEKRQLLERARMREYYTRLGKPIPPQYLEPEELAKPSLDQRRGAIREPIIAAAAYLGARAIAGATNTGERIGAVAERMVAGGFVAAGAIGEAGAKLATYRTFWRRMRWTTLALTGGLALSAMTYLVYATSGIVASGAVSGADFIAATVATAFGGGLWGIVFLAKGTGWIFAEAFHAVIGAIVGLALLAAKLTVGAAKAVATNILQILIGVALCVLFVAAIILLGAVFVAALPRAARGLGRGSDRAADVVASGALAGARGAAGAARSVSLFGRVLKAGYVAVKSNTCPEIVFKDDE